MVNGYWLVTTSNSIRNERPGKQLEQLAGYIEKHPHSIFLISKGVKEKLDRWKSFDWPNVVFTKSGSIDFNILDSSEIEFSERKANHHDYTVTWFGPYEVNYNYYPNYHIQNDRLVVMRPQRATSFNVFKNQFSLSLRSLPCLYGLESYV